ncbi:MAG: bacillithiol system redox-active protein YtxJ [Flavobacterium sp.]|nr:bacillithiol system redox-active protein YtxJ [Flavobacterium sp.]
MGFLNSIFGSSDEQQNHGNITWNQLTDLGQLNEIIDISTTKPVVIFKHSTRCSISRMALKQFENEFDLHEKVTPYFLDLLNHRDISNEIATRFEVTHQSPQLILIQDGKSVYNVSHSDIQVEDLKTKLQ